MTAKFTPGPWTADGMAICGAGTDYDVDGCTVALINRSMAHNRFTRLIKSDEPEANAKLIAAAPELLEMCGEALIEFEACHEVMMLNPANRGMQPAAIIGKLRALIQKAEAQQ